MAKLTEKQLLSQHIEMCAAYIGACILMDTKHSQEPDIQLAHSVLSQMQHTLKLLAEKINPINH